MIIAGIELSEFYDQTDYWLRLNKAQARVTASAAARPGGRGWQARRLLPACESTPSLRVRLIGIFKFLICNVQYKLPA